MKRLLLYIFAAFVIILQACGTSKIIVPGHHKMIIYIDGKRSGKDSVEITRTGIPHKLNIEVKHHGALVADQVVKRKFTFVTFLVGYLTYGAGFFTAWQYPETILIDIEKKVPGDWKQNSWDKPNENAWDKSGW